ncbi:MAG: GspE/PulE family protein, partial [Dehalococcoidia bacterium]|nr:GspE/PulE family protein [Dehalococcoidia bacterium]
VDAKVKGNSGAEHTFAMMAHKDDGLFSYDVVIGLSVSQREEVGLGAVFNFDEKANDAGIADRVFLAIPKLGSMAANFAQQEHIKVFDEKELNAFLGAAPLAAKHHKPIEFGTKAQILKSLTEHGYKTEEKVKIKGVSGTEYSFDILAYSEDGLITHPISIDFLSADDEVGLEPVSLIDARAQDTGIIRGVLVVSPKLSDEARQVAQKRQVKVFEATKVATQKLAGEPQTPKKAAAQANREPATIKVPESASAGPSVVTGSASGVAKLNLLVQTPTPEALNLIPEKLARKYSAVPLSVSDNTLRVAMANPDDILAIQALSAKTKMRIEAVLAAPADVQEAIDFNYKAFGEIGKQFGLMTPNVETITLDRSAAEIADDSPVAKALNLLVEEAVKSRSSDIHIEPEADRLRVRYRIDGILHEVTSLPIGAHGPLISRIKILSGMNIADPRRPQDGQFSLTASGKDIDIRVATISTVHGETAVLRLLDKSMAALSLSQIGFLPESQEIFERMLMAPYGMILLSGPTGAGKTTTLYAAVNTLDKVGRNIITIEDPVEYRFQGINQIQINVKAGVTFASGLRAIVRLDPDIILVGEIRDSETAEIATQSALTGHLVLSSVHANDTIGVLFRLIDLGVEPFLICSAVICIIAQRMVRRVCRNCAKKTEAALVEQTAYHRETGEECTEFSYGTGCKLCTYTGYQGRTGIFEILSLSDEIKRLIITRAPASEIRNQAIEEGMVTLAKDGMRKAGAGITTPYEVLRNAYSIGD